ncbi:MAG TPA: phosphate regulon transcriptional regulatory protein PhoB [Chromatiales bacterium]|nr:phosphate regulon transcriptional regulatory protein PhoB [Thiotrichales bacterium]HIP68644.1 phosphate regulon transcriptional regulatory protein PhoB [Chromatiales bacterium]
MATQILLVEDEAPIREMIRFALAREGFDILEAGDVQAARTQIADNSPELLIVDWMLPDASGVELVRGLRRDPVHRDIPVIMLTARSKESDKVKGLDSGADDYMTKPVAIRELLARINALIRRSQGHQDAEEINAGPLTIDLAGHRLLINGESIHIGQTEYRLLKFFMSHIDRVYSRAQLLDFVWGQNVYVEERTVDVHILRLRKLLKPFGADKMIQTVRGAGYRFSTKIENEVKA